MVLGLLLLSPLAARAEPAWMEPGPGRAPPIEQETARGAWDRGMERLEIVNRGTHMRRVNEGLLGRRNATDYAADEAERPSRPPAFIREW